MEKIQQILNGMLTGKDNKTHDIGHWSWFVCTLGVLGAAAGNWWHHLAIDLQALGAALSAVALAHGGALWAKRETEPGQ